MAKTSSCGNERALSEDFRTIDLGQSTIYLGQRENRPMASDAEECRGNARQ